MKIRKLLAFGVVFACGVQFASAQAQGLDLFIAQAYTQTDASTTALQGYYAAERIDLSGTVSDPLDGAVQRANGTLDTLIFQSPPPQFLFQTSLDPSLADFQSNWDFGSYNFFGNAGFYSGTVDNFGSMWVPTPALVSNFAALTGGIKGGAAFTVDFNAFTPDGSSNSATTFLSLFNLTTNAFVDGAALAPGATSWQISAADLLPLNSYEVVVDDANRLYGSRQANFQGAVPGLSYDTNTSVFFQTVPEPGPFAVVGLGVLGLLLRRRRG